MRGVEDEGDVQLQHLTYQAPAAPGCCAAPSSYGSPAGCILKKQRGWFRKVGCSGMLTAGIPSANQQTHTSCMAVIAAQNMGTYAYFASHWRRTSASTWAQQGGMKGAGHRVGGLGRPEPELHTEDTKTLCAYCIKRNPSTTNLLSELLGVDGW
jgi:hypothetical protein